MESFPLSPQIGYSLRNALALARASRLAYEAPEQIATQLQRWGFARHRCFGADGTQAFAAADDRTVVVAFRGTNSEIADFVADLDLPKVPGPAGLVHRGFLRALNAVWDRVHQAITVFRDQEQRVFLTGHSLGAALATLATARLEFDTTCRTAGLYTFGSPRVGDRRFQRASDAQFGQRTFRFANYRDLVTRVPFEFLGYHHVGRVFFFDASGRLHEDPWAWHRSLVDMPLGDSLEDKFAPTSPHRYTARAQLLGLLEQYKCNHSVDRYVELLERVAAGT